MPSQPFKIVKDDHKEMPCNIEAEQALIGSVLISNDIFDDISILVDSAKFYDPVHVLIFEARYTLDVLC